MYIDGMFGFLLGILIIWGGYAVSVVICTTIANKIENGAKQGVKMAEIIRKYRDKHNSLVTEYKCSVCGEPTLRYRSVGKRRALCIDCTRREENERVNKRKQDLYNKGCKDTVDEVKSLINHYLIDAMNLENATKYGNKDAKQQDISYGTLMRYEIANCVDDLMESIELLQERNK